MTKVRDNMPPEAEEARLLFIELARLRKEGKAEALRAVEANLSRKARYLKSLVAGMLEDGIEVHEVVKATGMSRQTVTNYRKDHLAIFGEKG